MRLQAVREQLRRGGLQWQLGAFLDAEELSRSDRDTVMVLDVVTQQPQKINGCLFREPKLPERRHSQSDGNRPD